MSVRPPASVAVTVSSRWDGYSWSGALNDPPADARVVLDLVRVARGRSHAVAHDERPGKRRVRRACPAAASVAWPEKAIGSPTFQRSVGAGRVDRDARRRVAGPDHDGVGVAEPALVAHRELRGEVARGAVRVRGLGRGRVGRAVAVEVPGVGERVRRVRVGRARGVEVDVQRQGAVRRVGRGERVRCRVRGGRGADAADRARADVHVVEVAVRGRPSGPPGSSRPARTARAGSGRAARSPLPAAPRCSCARCRRRTAPRHRPPGTSRRWSGRTRARRSRCPSWGSSPRSRSRCCGRRPSRGR